jgi:hypothetical protein
MIAAGNLKEHASRCISNSSLSAQLVHCALKPQPVCSQRVQRRSLRSIMPDASKVFENFFQTLDIQEPAFKNVVVLYRRKVPDNPQRKSEYEPIRKHNVVRTVFPLSSHASQSPHQRVALVCGW